MGFQVIIFAAIASILVAEKACNCHVININFSYNSFNVNKDARKFNMSGATIESETLQVTRASSNSDPQYSSTNISGSALLKRNFRVYYGSKIASFTTSFVFNIQRENGNGGEGLAFTITSNNYLPANSFGKWLGLFNASINGRNSSKVVAVEFDTSKSAGTNDPDGNHVGINVNNINSTNLTRLPADQISLTGNYDIQAWIQYDGNTKKLDVYVANMSDPMPSQASVSSIVDLSKILDSKAYFGFSASTGIGTELHRVKAWNFTIEPVSLPNWGLLISLPVCLPLALGATIWIILLLQRRKSQAEEENKIFEELDKIPGQLREFRYKDLKKATNNFSPTALLGSGGSGTVYKGILPKGKNVVAVKRMTKGSKQGKDEFISEVSVINRLRHRNLVPLLGWCHKKGQLIMVYEFMPNCSLDKHIFNEDIADGFLDWEQRYNIVSGVASALLYLHEECDQKVIHRDVKASNIMLDSEYKARLGDFGLARLIEHDQRSFTTTGVVGTPGYIAPECFHTGRATAESDVFSFGAVALEVTCGRHPTSSSPEAPDLVGWVWKLYRQNNLLEAADSRLARFGSVNINNEDDVKRLLMLGLACSNPNPEARPTMREVTQVVARTMLPTYVPPFRPAFVWAHLPTDINFPKTSTTNSLASFEGVLSSMNTLLPSSEPNQNARRFAAESMTFSDIDF